MKIAIASDHAGYEEKERLKPLLDELGIQYEDLGTVKGSELVGLTYKGPFDDLPAASKVKHEVIPWQDVGEEEGTGIVHIAPGCGAEDFDLSKQFGLDVLVPIDENGVYGDKYGLFAGEHVADIERHVAAAFAGCPLFDTLTRRVTPVWRSRT